jgi:predicted ribosome quality control (RQC) complex YloA/Tae2 family protein
MADRVTDELNDPDWGVWRGVEVARRFLSPDGMVVLVGRSASDNDVLTLKLAEDHDFWMHASGVPGSHVVVRNPGKLSRLPRETQRFAASMAATFSKARHGGRVAVHVCRIRDVSKSRGQKAGMVSLRRFETTYASPLLVQPEGDKRCDQSDPPE